MTWARWTNRVSNCPIVYQLQLYVSFKQPNQSKPLYISSFVNFLLFPLQMRAVDDALGQRVSHHIRLESDTVIRDRATLNADVVAHVEPRSIN